MTDTGRPEFRAWIDNQPDSAWTLMPLTHVCKALIGGDIARAGRIEPKDCPVFKRALAYFFYGRPAYRVTGDGAIKIPAACPMCLIFDPDLIHRAQSIHPFDTGAFHARMYSHVMLDEMKIEDFGLGRETDRPNQLISALFGTREAYYDSDPSKIPPGDQVAAPDEFLVHAYLELLRSTGRNEPDDRLGTIEVVFGDPVPLAGNLLAAVVPDILWNDKNKAPWLLDLSATGVDILPFRYAHARHPEYHHAMIETEVREYLESRGDL
jgi:hypothetical protein